MNKPKLIRWSDDGYPPIDLNEQLSAVIELINHSRSLESQVKELREALDKTMNIICDHRGVFPAFRHFMEDEEIQSIEKLQRKLLNKQP